MDWSDIVSTSPNKLSTEALAFARINLSSVDSGALNTEQLRKFFELSCFLLQHEPQSIQNDISSDRKKVKGDGDTDETYYIQTIQELNREIAQYVYNKKTSTENAANTVEPDATQPIATDTKKDLLYKIHVKNKYIKRLLGENDALKEEIHQQKEQIIVLNVSLKQTAHKLNKALGDLMEQKQQNHITVDDMADLHTKISSVREQMTRIEHDKQKYKHDVLYLGDEIQKKIYQWNELLKKKYNSGFPDGVDDGHGDGHNVSNDDIIKRNEISKAQTNQMAIQLNDESALLADQQHDGNRFEVNILSQAINKRNLIISEMESLLIDLTMEISQSAIVINRIIKNLAQRETNFASNLEKLRNHLAKLLDRPNNFVEHDTQTVSLTTTSQIAQNSAQKQSPTSTRRRKSSRKTAIKN